MLINYEYMNELLQWKSIWKLTFILNITLYSFEEIIYVYTL